MPNGNESNKPDKSAFASLGGVAGDVIKGLGLVAASAAIPGFGQSFVGAQQRNQQMQAQARQNLIDDLQQAPRIALNPAIQKDIKRTFGDDALQQFIGEANRIGAAEAFIKGVMGGAADTTLANEIAGGGAPVSAPAGQAAAPIPAATPSQPTPTSNVAPTTTRRGRTPATALQERLEPGQSASVRSNGITISVKGLTADERAASEFDNLLNEVVDNNPGISPEQAIRTAARQSVGRINFAGLPDEARTILTSGTIEEIQQFVQARYERIRAKEQTVGEREGRLEQPLANDELVGSVVQSQLDTINAVLESRGLPPLNEQESSNLRLDSSRSLQKDMATEKARATSRGTIGAPLRAAKTAEENIRPLAPKDSDFFSTAGSQMEAWTDTLGLMETEAQKFGPLSGRFHNLAEAYGLESVEFTRTKTGLNRMVQQAVRLMEGARATEQDRQFTLDLFPKPTDPPAKIIGNTVAALQETLRLVRRREKQLNSEGFRVPPVDVPQDLLDFLDAHTPAKSLDEVRKEIGRKR